MSDQYDAIVIGSGQGGIPLALAFAEAGKRTAIVERAVVGGTCINYGCTPTKTLVHVAKVAHTVRRAGEYGVHTSHPKVDMVKARELKRAIVNDFRESIEKTLIDAPNLELIYGHASFSEKDEVCGYWGVEVSGSSGSRNISAKTVFINTGTRPRIPAIEGLDEVPYLDNASAMELDDVPESLLVLGASYIGLEFGQMFARFGSRVTIIEPAPRFLPHEDEDVAQEILRILRDDGIDVRLGSTTVAARRAVRPNDVRLTIKTADGEETQDGSQLLVAVGRSPNTHDLNLQAAGVETDEHGFVKVDERLRTSAEGIYAIGDVNGGPAFTHISYDDYRILKANLLDGEDRTTAGRLVPYTLFIDPELGRIGLSEDEARRKGIQYRLCKMEMTHVARALEMNESRGFVKALVAKDTDKILGAAVLGVEGGEVMSMIELAMIGGLTAADLNRAVFAHPALSELLNNLFA